MWCLGIDPSLTNVGIAVVPCTGQVGSPATFLIKTPSKYNKAGSLARLDYLRTEVGVVLHACKGLGALALALIEAPAWNRKGAGVQHSMGEGSGIIRLAVWNTCDQVRMNPPQWRSEIAPGISDGKRGYIDRAVELGCPGDPEKLTDHEAEAYLMALVARRFYEGSLTTVAKDGIEVMRMKVME